MSKSITVSSIVNANINKVWEYYTKPEHIVNWNSASEDWHTPSATNELKAGGSFNYRMEAKDGSTGFDFEGTYDQVVDGSLIKYTIGDRKVTVTMNPEDGQTKVDVTFELESQNSEELQRGGWQAILDNFKKYVELN